jgi:hypothetical protein
MRPIVFPESNGTLGGGPASRYGTLDAVADLPVYRGSGQVISCWQLTVWERVKLLLSGRVWLLVLGTNHAPVSVVTERPFQEPGRHG